MSVVYLRVDAMISDVEEGVQEAVERQRLLWVKREASERFERRSTPRVPNSDAAISFSTPICLSTTWWIQLIRDFDIKGVMWDIVDLTPGSELAVGSLWAPASF